MKKLKLRGRELEKIGFTSGELISITINLIQKHFKRSDKVEVLNLLTDLIINPVNYKDDPRFSSLIEKLLPEKHIKTKHKPEEVRLEQVRKDYIVFGQSYIEQEAINPDGNSYAIANCCSGCFNGRCS